MAARRVGGMTPAYSVLFYTDAPVTGGAEHALRSLVSELAPELGVSIAGTHRATVEWVAAGRPGARAVVLPPVRHKLDLRSLWAHWRVLRRSGADIIQANITSPRSCRYALLVALLPPRRRVVAVEHLPAPSATGWQRWWRRAISRRLEAHVAVGEQGARFIERDLGLSSGRVVPIPNGVADMPVNRSARRATSVVGSVGRLHPQKGYDVLLDAVARLDGVSLVLVGDGPERERLERQADELGIDHRVTITGWVDNPRDHLGAFDIFVLPSRNEGLPLSIVEAMLAGLPVVASNVGSVAEAVMHGVTGLLVDAGDVDGLVDAIAQMVADPSARDRMGEAGRAVALERFTVARMARSFEELYAGGRAR